MYCGRSPLSSLVLLSLSWQLLVLPATSSVHAAGVYFPNIARQQKEVGDAAGELSARMIR